MHFTRVRITTTVPVESADKLRDALGKAGAGILGEYSYCSFSVTGSGRFIASANANPVVGEVNKLEVVHEDQVSVNCDLKDAKKIVAALREAHPYEEPLIDIIPLINEEDL